ncbi:uncharacterized protein C12orf71 homolog [Sciurus carolinensis]|uniref:uncharacterized protein C12orf71 homolog n=1 Tax=Sciurus carolinensis TaxID=30640 RepID=UPI001FB36CAE|nr:uncharacterized protein C12orf71 homolog [Sciurus carolinensis]
MKNLKAFLDNLKDDKDDDPVLSDSPQEKDLQPSSSASSQVSHQEPEACQDLPKCKPPGNGDIDQVLEDDEIVEMESQATSSVSAEQLKGDTPSEEETTCCLKFGSIFQWLRKRVASSLPRRKRPGRVDKGTILLALKRRY